MRDSVAERVLATRLEALARQVRQGHKMNHPAVIAVREDIYRECPKPEPALITSWPTFPILATKEQTS